MSLDGGETYQEAKGEVRLIYDDLPILGDDNPGRLLLNFIDDGILVEVWSQSGHISTAAWTVHELADRIAR